MKHLDLITKKLTKDSNHCPMGFEPLVFTGLEPIRDNCGNKLGFGV